MYSDPIADLLTRIRNAYKARKDALTVPSSKAKLSILKVLKDRKFIADFETKMSGKFEEIEIRLNEDVRDITLKRVSKPGQRIYVIAGSLKKVNGGLGLAIISTPRGVMSNDEATKLKLGGELICEVY